MSPRRRKFLATPLQPWFDFIVCSITYQTSHVLVVCFFLIHMSSASGEFAPRPLPGLCPWTPLGDFRPQTPWFVPLSKFLATPLYEAAFILD